MLINRTNLNNLPSTSGVYFFCEGKKIIYIGKSVNIKARVKSHFENAKVNQKEAAIISNASQLKYLITDSEIKALLLESKLIQKYQPRYNAVWKDDRSYLYIKITKEKYPKILAVRKENDQRSVYFGPFSSQKQVNLILREVRKIFPYCAQKKITKQPCFHSKIALCNPCPNFINSLKNKQQAAIDRKRYLKNIRRIKDFLSAKDQKLLKELKKELKQLSLSEQYEEAISLRNKIQIIENFLKQKISGFDYARDYNLTEKNLRLLEDLLLPYFGRLNLVRIEGYDVSNLNQKEATASMVVLSKGAIDKSQYKKFKIKITTLKSDFEMLQNTIERRFRNSWPRPDLILVDGGRPQVRILKETLKKLRIPVPIVGLAKDPDRLVVGDDELTQIKTNYHQADFQLLQQLRDEAHRFARKYHLYLRNKKFLL